MDVLLASPSDVILSRLSRSVTETGQSATCCKNSDALLAELEKNPTPRLLLLDDSLAPQSAVSIIQKLRLTLPNPQHFIILLSDSLTLERRIEALRSGADICLSKKMEEQELQAWIQNASLRIDCQAALIRQMNDMTEIYRERYTILEKLGSGGIGTVYRGFDALLQREVALKFLKADPDSQFTDFEAALNESRMMASLQHPNLITVLDCGQNEQGTFLVMEIVEGESLQSKIGGTPLRPDAFNLLVEQSLKGIQTAHSAGILHLDIKPSNIMFGFIGNTGSEIVVKLLDFGLARFRPNLKKNQNQEHHSVYGSVPYIAPERLKDEPVDRRADLYSLGHIYYLALTGKHAFAGKNTQETLQAHLFENPAPPSTLRAGVSPALDQWVAWLIAKEPDRRPSTASEALKAFPRFSE